MKYTFDFKMMCIEKYRNGTWEKAPNGIKDGNFRRKIRAWVRTLESSGPEALRHSPTNKLWTPEERFELVSKVLAGSSCLSVSISAGISNGLLYKWVRSYKLKGYEGLCLQKGRPSKELDVKKKEPRQLTQSELEEFKQMKARIEFLETENAAIKKSIALSHKRWDAQLKAKKQKSSRNSEDKDTN